MGFIVTTHSEQKDYHQFIGYGVEGYYIETKMMPVPVQLERVSEPNDFIKNVWKVYAEKQPKEVFNRDNAEGAAAFIMIPKSVSFLGRITVYNSKYLTEVLTKQGNSEAPTDSFYSERLPIDPEHYFDNLKLLGSEAGLLASREFNLMNVIHRM